MVELGKKEILQENETQGGEATTRGKLNRIKGN